MNDVVWKRREVDSPCVKLCTVHPVEGLCIGCLRSIAEITAWSRMSLEDRSRIMAELPSRAPRLRQRRGGRSARPALSDATDQAAG